MTPASFFEKIKLNIRGAKVVSFDIFDTLFLRPYIHPIDLFYHLEHIENMPCYAISRIEAEKTARRNHPEKEDVTLDDIYHEIDEVFKPMKQKELSLETQVLKLNPEVFQIYKYVLEKNKKVIFSSDMYLPFNYIKELLEKNNIVQYEKIYVSGIVGKTKASGSLYEYIANDLKIRGKNIIHIGDNKKSDYKKAKEAGFRAILYKQVNEQFLKTNKRARIFRKQANGNLGASILLSLMAWHWQKKQLGIIHSSYWEDLGYEYAGPVCYGFARWIEHEAKKAGITDLLFVARDGYTLQKIFKTFNTKIKNYYIYAPRFLNLICRLDYARENKNQSSTVVDYFSKIIPQLKKLANSNKFNKAIDYHNFIQENKKIIEKYALTEWNNYRRYLSKTPLDKNSSIGLVDTITCEFSSQKLLQNTINLPIIGFYWSVIRTQFQGIYNHQQFIQNSGFGVTNSKVFTKNWNFIEFLMTAPEFPIKKITPNGYPVYDNNPSEYEKIRKQIYPQISDNAVSFSNDVKSFFNGQNIFLDAPILIRWINCFCDNPTHIDVKTMASIRHAPDSNHNVYVPLFSTIMQWSLILKMPCCALKIAKKTIWRTCLQTIAVCIFDPIKLRIRGLKSFRLIIFPKLRNRYFTCSLNLDTSHYYQLIVGSEEDIK